MDLGPFLEWNRKAALKWLWHFRNFVKPSQSTAVKQLTILWYFVLLNNKNATMKLVNSFSKFISYMVNNNCYQWIQTFSCFFVTSIDTVVKKKRKKRKAYPRYNSFHFGSVHHQQKRIAFSESMKAVYTTTQLSTQHLRYIGRLYTNKSKHFF